MAKKAPSKHSRSARRATSPGIDLDKSLKNAKPPPESVDFRPSVLGIHQMAGVTKKVKKHGRKAILSSKARRRQERGFDKAAAVLERTAKKVERSRLHARNTYSRRAAWDDINTRVLSEVVDGSELKKKESLRRGQQAGDDDNEAAEADSGDEAVRKFYTELDEDMAEVAVKEAASGPASSDSNQQQQQQQPAAAMAEVIVSATAAIALSSPPIEDDEIL